MPRCLRIVKARTQSCLGYEGQIPDDCQSKKPREGCYPRGAAPPHDNTRSDETINVTLAGGRLSHWVLRMGQMARPLLALGKLVSTLDRATRHDAYNQKRGPDPVPVVRPKRLVAFN